MVLEYTYRNWKPRVSTIPGTASDDFSLIIKLPSLTFFGGGGIGNIFSNENKRFICQVYLISKTLHSNENKLFTKITNTCFSERTTYLPAFITTYNYM